MSDEPLIFRRSQWMWIVCVVPWVLMVWFWIWSYQTNQLDLLAILIGVPVTLGIALCTLVINVDLVAGYVRLEGDHAVFAHGLWKHVVPYTEITAVNNDGWIAGITRRRHWITVQVPCYTVGYGALLDELRARAGLDS